uniref:disease resistance protein RUN1-like n=1 Tax=Erigeron canadensis TaxID=72917 RepID=UPI001CB89215|nr:disease resistance protein RUN1-like [Erigeron canadensis]
MHDHIEEMGVHTVRRLDPDEPERHKLLWIKDEIEHIEKEDMGTEAIRGIKLPYMRVHAAIISQSLRKMRNLCFLYVGWPFETSGSYSRRVYEYFTSKYHLPNSLQFLHWKGYPFRYLPKTFQGDNLVEMEIPESHKLWKGGGKKAFRRSGIIAFKDDKDIMVGEKISEELPKAIKESKFYMVIFSKKFADSYWCLNELVEILKICQNPEEEEKRAFYPVFYDVKPSEVREQKGPVGEAFSVHSENEAAGRWREAMEKAANLEGWELTKTADGHEVQFIEKIIHNISQKPYLANFSVNKNLVGMTTRVEKLLLSLQVGFDDIRMLGITGLGGVGNTTLASVVFNRIANQFDGKSFVENVRERSKDPKGLHDMQQQVLTSVFGDPKIRVSSDVEGRNMMKRRMPNIKVLVVLDDVNDVKQLEALAEPSWFRPGSRIIITSRDTQVLVAHGVESHNIHDVGTLSDEDAIRLLSRHAFGTESPTQGYEELSEKVVRYAAGLPLTIKTLSSSLGAQSTDVWEDAIKELKEIPWDDTLKILKISYDALREHQKDIFLHVACLLKGERKKNIIRILESLGFHAQIGLSVLEQRSLITFRHDSHYDEDDYKRLGMHDHIEEMGMHIVRSLHPDEPQQHKLLWINDEIEDIIEKDMGTEVIRGIKLSYLRLPPAKVLHSLRKMSGLFSSRRVVKLCNISI